MLDCLHAFFVNVRASRQIISLFFPLYVFLLNTYRTVKIYFKSSLTNASIYVMLRNASLFSLPVACQHAKNLIIIIFLPQLFRLASRSRLCMKVLHLGLDPHARSLFIIFFRRCSGEPHSCLRPRWFKMPPQASTHYLFIYARLPSCFFCKCHTVKCLCLLSMLTFVHCNREHSR